MFRAACAGNILRLCTSTVSHSVPNSVHCRMISFWNVLASCTIPSWICVTLNYANFFFRTRLPDLDNCFGRFTINHLNICRATQFYLDAVSPCRGEISQFCVWCLTVNTVDVLSNTSRTDISTFVDVSRWSYMIFIRAFHGQLSRFFSGVCR